MLLPRRIGLWTVLGIALLNGSAWGQSLRIDAWNADAGLPANVVNHVLQTRDGFLWMATFAGLVRYDGARFEVFSTGTTSQLKSSRFVWLFEDRDGSLWAETEGQGVVRYRDGVFTSHAVAPSTPEDGATFFNAPDGHLWFDSRNGAAEWDGERFVPRSPPSPSLTERSVLNVFRQPSGATWSLDAAALHKHEGGRITRTIAVRDGRWMFEDSRGRVWVEIDDAGTRRLIMIDGDTTRRFSSADGVPTFRTMSVLEDRDGTLWFGLFNGGGLLRFKDGAFTRYTTADGLPHNNVGRPYQDREGTIWLPTEGGLARITTRVVTPYSMSDGLAAENTYPIYQDRRGVIWIGGWQGLTTYADGAFRKIPLPDGSSKDVLALHEDRDGTLWIGMWGGLSRMQNGVISSVDLGTSNGLVVRAVEQDAAGDIWIGGSGLWRFSKGTLQRINPPDGPAGRSVLSIRARPDGGLWIGTDAGLTDYRNGRFLNYDAARGMSGTNVRSLYVDRQGVLWAGTYDTGLFRVSGDRITRFTVREGLADNGAFQILEDARGNFWISSNTGIYRVSRADLDRVAAGGARTVTAVPYGKRDGMLTAECNGGGQPAGLRAADGRLWFPTQKGVAVIDADHLNINALPPPVVLTSMTIDRQPVPLGSTLEIQPGQTAFEINYAGLTFVRPELTRFRYKLEGLDADWVDAGTRPTAYFSHVPYGNYRFVVSAANRDGVWNDTGAAIPVAVIAPFWATRWFQVSLAIAFAAVLALAYRRRILGLHRAQAVRDTFARQLIDSQEAERRRIASELHDSLGQTLIVINNRALAGVKTAAGDPQAQARWNELSATATSAINEVREIAYNLGPYQIDRLGLADTIHDMVDRMAHASGIEFTTHLDDVDGVFEKDAEVGLYRMIQESVNNIVKHSGASRAKITLRLDQSSATLTVEDNGHGFDVTTPEDHDAPRGFGLQGLRERARILGGRFEITSQPGLGTRITVRLPVLFPI